MQAQNNILAIIQARLGSTRLPGKVLADIVGEPMLARVISRVAAAKKIDAIAVATSNLPADDPIVELCAAKGIAVYRGSESDVLDRYYQAAKERQAAIVVRITADCPLIDPQVIDRVVSAFLTDDCDYASNTIVCSYPDGLDVEVFSFAALASAWRDARRSTDREHVTSYLRSSGRFRLRNVESPLGGVLHEQRWTVDEARDLEFVRAIYSRLPAHTEFGWRDVLKLLDNEPALAKINGDQIRNAGFYRSIAQGPAVAPQMRRLDRSHELYEKARTLIPGATQTLSKGVSQFVRGVAPIFLARAKGSQVWDVDGNQYIDYPMALGPIILGHGYPAVDQAVERQMQDGVSFSLPHPLEIEVAERLTAMIPCAEMVRFGKNGSDATAGAVRLARAHTGRDVIVCCGYHGWQDWYIGSTTFNRGVPAPVRDLLKTFDYNDIDSLAQRFAEYPGQIAAVIMEPIGVVEPRDGFLAAVRELCQREGALLIFDEVITGFRLARGGAQEYFGVVPDLACFGKALANGFPLSAVVGPRAIMKTFEQTFFSFTFGGEAVSLAAANATLKEIAEKEVIAHLWEMGRQLNDGFKVLAKEFAVDRFMRSTGLAPRTAINFFDDSGRESLLVKSLFQQECLKRGVLFSGGQMICFSHSSADIEQTLRVYRSAMEIVGTALRQGNVAEKLEGAPVEPVFRRA